eukprot:m51a1_g426 putative vm3c_croat ame: full=zinc metalloproteinase-disintegrin-like catroriarin ame: full=snake venom metalloproteinase short=svmp (609) ;mRNA; f:28398-30508
MTVVGVLLAGIVLGTALAVRASIVDQIATHDVVLPVSLKQGDSNWRVWGTSRLTTRLFFTPLIDTGYAVGWTDGTLDGHVSFLSQSFALDSTLDFAGRHAQRSTRAEGRGGPTDPRGGWRRELRGLAAHSDRTCGVLLWNNEQNKMWVREVDSAGTTKWETEIQNSGNNPTDFGIGDSRMAYGDSKYGVYYHVHSDSGHEGDTLHWVAQSNGADTSGWGWGCSHSMSNLINFNANSRTWAPVCVSDCYPGTTSSDFATGSVGGVYTWASSKYKIKDLCAGCNGDVAGELGSMAAAPAGGWKLVFNGHQGAAQLGQKSYDKSSMNQDIAFATMNKDGSINGTVVWLTTTAGVNEDDPSIARFLGVSGERYLVGWRSGLSYFLAEVDGSGSFLSGPTNVTGHAAWGKRDDPFRSAQDGSVAWVYSPTGSTDLRVVTVKPSVTTSTCKCFEGACCDGCKYRTSGTVCRVSRGDCDPAETCSGTSASCPKDVFKTIGQACDDSNSCTNNDVCSVGYKCKGQWNCTCSSASACNDNNPCTTETCTAKACVYTKQTGTCDDKDALTVDDTCSAEGYCIGNYTGGGDDDDGGGHRAAAALAVTLSIVVAAIATHS